MLVDAIRRRAWIRSSTGLSWFQLARMRLAGGLADPNRPLPVRVIGPSNVARLTEPSVSDPVVPHCVASPLRQHTEHIETVVRCRAAEAASSRRDDFRAAM